MEGCGVGSCVAMCVWACVCTCVCEPGPCWELSQVVSQAEGSPQSGAVGSSSCVASLWWPPLAPSFILVTGSSVGLAGIRAGG